MADQKISQLPAAATPLAGTEVLPIVQSGTTVKVSAADVTAGRSVSAANLVVTSATVPANGVYLPSANSLGFGTDTTERMRIDSSGNVGIGTSSPTSELDVFKTKTGVVKVSVGNNVGAANDAARFNLNYNGTSIGSYGYVWDGGAFNNALDYYSTLAITQQGTERMRITSAGNVGIGTSSPGQRLTVVSSSTSLAQFTGPEYAQVRHSDGTRAMFTQVFNNEARLFSETSTPLVLGTNNTERMRIDSAGRLLVGQTGPLNNGTIDVLGTARQAIVARVTDNVNSVFQGFNSAATATSQIDGSGNGYFAGNVGIGTSSPAYKLDIQDSAAAALRLSTTVNGNAQVIVDATGGASILDLQTAAGINRIAGGLGGTSNMAFYTASTERMRIDSSGNLLVGRTTVPVQNTAGAAIQPNGLFVTESSQTQGGLWVNRITSDGNAVYFTRQNVEVGSISVTGTATAYNTSSDYRLKDIDGPIGNSGAYIDALKPVQGSWKADGSRFIGLLAHEVQEVSETQIATGEKDGEEMQAMDYSAPEIIANLIAEIQSLRARVAQLEGN